MPLRPWRLKLPQQRLRQLTQLPHSQSRQLLQPLSQPLPQWIAYRLPPHLGLPRLQSRQRLRWLQSPHV